MEDEIMPISQEVAMQGEQESAEDIQEYQQEQQESAIDQSGGFGNFADNTPRETLLTLFWKVLGLKDNSKVGNLDKFELGKLDLSVRNNQSLSHLGKLLHNQAFSNYFNDRSEIILRTSASKKGWQQELFISQKRNVARVTQPMNTASTMPAKSKWSLWGNKKPAEQQ